MPEKYIMVTGAGKGIGFSLTKKFLEDPSCTVFAIFTKCKTTHRLIRPVCESCTGRI
jgi:NAD(P)-dependent dehydrogenase (short-subunit alcohol dehydrogenase family)